MDGTPAFFPAMLAAYGLAQDTHAQQISERVWRVFGKNGDFAAKIYAAHHAARARKEAAILAYLQQNHARYRVQRLQPTLAGTTLWCGPNAHVLLTHWAAGSVKTYNTFTAKEWSALGGSLAALHQQLETLKLPEVECLYARLAAIKLDEVRSSLNTLARHATQKHAPSGLSAYVNACLGMLDTHYPRVLSGFSEHAPQALIHNDYNQFNYLFDGQLPPVILDWEAAIQAPHEYELVRCLNHLPLEAPLMARQFVQAYAQVRPVHANRLPWAVDAACLQHALKQWVWEGWVREPQRFAAHLQGSIKMVSMMAGARESLIEFFTQCLARSGS